MPDERSSVLKETIKMAWPAVLESVSVSIAGLIDTFMVSRLGPDAVAAVGITLNPKFVGLSVFIAVNVAVSALVARRRGEERRDEANAILLAAISFVFATGLIIGSTFAIFADPIMRFSGAGNGNLELSVSYFKIIMGLIVPLVMTNAINAALRGAGNTKISMKTNITAAVVNIFFNYLLIEGHLGFPSLGVRGAALATVMGSISSLVMSIHALLGGEYLDIRYLIGNRIRMRIRHFKSLISVGYSIFVEQILLRIGLMAVSIMAAKQGSDNMAVHQVAMSFMGLGYSVGDGMQAAAVALVGRSLGRKEYEKAKRYRIVSLKLGAFLGLLMIMIYISSSGLIYRAYFPGTDMGHMVTLGKQVMVLVALVVFFQLPNVIDSGCLRGAGDVFYTTVVSTIGATVVRAGFAFLFCIVLRMGIIGIWIGVILDQLTRDVILALRFRTDKWTRICI